MTPARQRVSIREELPCSSPFLSSLLLLSPLPSPCLHPGPWKGSELQTAPTPTGNWLSADRDGQKEFVSLKLKDVLNYNRQDILMTDRMTFGYLKMTRKVMELPYLQLHLCLGGERAM